MVRRRAHHPSAVTRRRLVALAVGVLACSAFWLALVAGSGSVQVLQAQSSSNAGRRPLRVVIKPLIAMAWMLLSLFLVASFTANVTSHLTVRQFQGIVRDEHDLPGKRIATVASSTAARYLDERQLPYQGVGTVEAAYELLESGAVDALVYDAPVLLYYANGAGQGKVAVVGSIFQAEDYGIALPSGSPDRELINRTLLSIIEDGTYDEIYRSWFSTASPRQTGYGVSYWVRTGP